MKKLNEKKLVFAISIGLTSLLCADTFTPKGDLGPDMIGENFYQFEEAPEVKDSLGHKNEFYTLSLFGENQQNKYYKKFNIEDQPLFVNLTTQQQKALVHLFRKNITKDSMEQLLSEIKEGRPLVFTDQLERYIFIHMQKPFISAAYYQDSEEVDSQYEIFHISSALFAQLKKIIFRCKSNKKIVLSEIQNVPSNAIVPAAPQQPVVQESSKLEIFRCVVPLLVECIRVLPYWFAHTETMAKHVNPSNRQLFSNILNNGNAWQLAGVALPILTGMGPVGAGIGAAAAVGYSGYSLVQKKGWDKKAWAVGKGAWSSIKGVGGKMCFWK